jgi:CRISPR-associated protein Cas5d
MKRYLIQLEIAGPTAMWTRPDTGSSPASYVAPTFCAAKGIFESITRWESVYIQPLKVEICKPIQFHRYATNYGGPLRNSSAIATGSSFQLFATVLVNVCYRLYAEIKEISRSPDGTFGPHAFQDSFNRRLVSGNWWRIPCLGWKEFAPDYIGPFRPGTLVCEGENHEIPSMLHMVFNKPQRGSIQPRYSQGLRVEKGVLTYAQ